MRAHWRHLSLICLAFCLAMACSRATVGATLYVATARNYIGTNDSIGRLFVVDIASGKVKLIGPIKVGDSPVGISGLAMDPKSGALFGITSATTPGFPSHLVTIDPSTGAATPVGPLSAAGTDINFDADGHLYVWLSEHRRLARVDLSTGKAAPFDVRGLEGLGGGLAVDKSGVAFVAVSSANGALQRIDLHRAEVIGRTSLVDAPFAASINSLTFSPAGLLLGVNSDGGVPPRTVLVNINPASGHVSAIVALPPDADGLAFSPDAPAAAGAGLKSKTLLLASAVCTILILLAVAYLRWPRPGRRTPAPD